MPTASHRYFKRVFVDCIPSCFFVMVFLSLFLAGNCALEGRIQPLKNVLIGEFAVVTANAALTVVYPLYHSEDRVKLRPSLFLGVLLLFYCEFLLSRAKVCPIYLSLSSSPLEGYCYPPRA